MEINTLQHSGLLVHSRYGVSWIILSSFPRIALPSEDVRNKWSIREENTQIYSTKPSFKIF
jgi:hypothetical protein